MSAPPGTSKNRSGNIRTGKTRSRKWFSLLTLRIWVIVIFPLAMFYIGLIHLDQYRLTVINSQLDALYRQGDTLARSIGMTDAEYSELARRRLSQLTMERATQLIASIPDARIRIFQPDGRLISDSALSGLLTSPRITLNPGQQSSRQTVEDMLQSMVTTLADGLSSGGDYPLYRENPDQSAGDFPSVIQALSGEAGSLIMRDRKGKLILGVAVPVRHLRVVRGALLVTASGEAAERDIRSVQMTFFIIFIGTLMVTIALGHYLARSIIGPVSRLARAADAVRLSKGNAVSLPKMMDRKDEIGDLARDLAAMTDELQMRMQATASFAADVAHEIKNPLTSLRSAVETIARVDDKEQQQKLMDIILADVQRLDRLISDISAASRLDADLNASAFSVVDLAGLVRSFADARSHGGMERGIRLEVETPDEAVMVHAITDRIVQVLDNLLGNAVSFSPDAGVIRLSLLVEGQNALLVMADEGIGIPKAKTDAIFSRFYSERPKSERFGQHSGLGLSISRKIVEAHGGTLTASNIDSADSGKTGAVLRMNLPINGTPMPPIVP